MEQLCPWETAKYFIYSSNIPTLFFYSHIPAIVAALIVGLLVFYKTNKSKVGISLLIISILFSLWSIFDLIIWATNRPDVVLFFWSLQILFEPLIYLICFYLVYLFVKNKDLPFKWKLFGIIFYSPVVFLLSSKYNLIGIDVAFCNAVEGFIAQYYTYITETVFILSIVFLIGSEYKNIPNVARKKEVTIFGLGVILFLMAFSSGNIIGSFSENWNLAQIGLMGMPIFLGFLAYLIVKFKTFNIKLFATQALVWILVMLIGSEFFFTQNNINILLIAITLVVSSWLGLFIVRSVKKEIQQREELEKLDIQLEGLLKQRESLVHLVTHKVKGSFTRIKFIFAGMLDGTFGEISSEIKKIAEQGLEFDDGGIQTVDLVLNAANMQNGTIKYENKLLDFKDVVSQTINDKRIVAETKGLKLETEAKEGVYNMMGDAFWLKEAVNNLIENSIKYTREGKIMVKLEKQNDKILLSVKDTGIGITEEDKKNLFTEGGRGKDSVKINIDSTGYGLYTVKLIAEAHKGRVWVESEGAGKGSMFTLELPSK
jgi:signal transduction histidine kinase